MAAKKKSARKAPIARRPSSTTFEARKRIFVKEYLKNGRNGTQAAIAAGYKPSKANERGRLLLKLPDVAAMVEEYAARLDRITGLDLERTLREVARVAYSDLRRLYREDGTLIPVQELDDETAAALASIENEELFEGRGEDRTHVGTVKKLKLWDKNAALEKAMKYHGLYREDNKQRAEASMPVTVIFGTGDAPKAG